MVGGPGGSSYISGHEGCNSVNIIDEKLFHTNDKYHPSGFAFRNTKMFDGLIANHSGSGLIKITLLRPPFLTQNDYLIAPIHLFLINAIFIIKN